MCVSWKTGTFPIDYKLLNGSVWMTWHLCMHHMPTVRGTENLLGQSLSLASDTALLHLFLNSQIQSNINLWLKFSHNTTTCRKHIMCTEHLFLVSKQRHILLTLRVVNHWWSCPARSCHWQPYWNQTLWCWLVWRTCTLLPAQMALPPPQVHLVPPVALALWAPSCPGCPVWAQGSSRHGCGAWRWRIASGWYSAGWPQLDVGPHHFSVGWSPSQPQPPQHVARALQVWTGWLQLHFSVAQTPWNPVVQKWWWEEATDCKQAYFCNNGLIKTYHGALTWKMLVCHHSLHLPKCQMCLGSCDDLIVQNSVIVKSQGLREYCSSDFKSLGLH